MIHASAFDRYRAGDSVVHAVDARVKVLATLAFLVSTVLLPDGAWPAFALGLALVLAVTALARLPLQYAVTRSLLALPFTLAAVTIAFNLPGTPVLRIPVGPWTLVATDAGLVRLASIVVRSLLSVQMAVLLTATTPFPEVIHALAHLRVPRPVVAVLAFMYRYLFVLADEALRLLRARDARSAARPGSRAGGTLRWRARMAGHLVGQLFVRSFERGERVYHAMIARGFQGELLALHRHAIRRGDWVFGAIALAAILGLQLVARL